MSETRLGDVFELVKLETRDGHLVGWTTIPNFRPCADTLVWGSRFFRFGEIFRGYILYREGFAFMVLNEVSEHPPSQWKSAAVREVERIYDEALEAGDACPGCVSPLVHDDAICPYIRKHGRPPPPEKR